MNIKEIDQKIAEQEQLIRSADPVAVENLIQTHAELVTFRALSLFQIKRNQRIAMLEI